MTTQYDAIILGAGAAGLFCAATAGQRGKRILLLDHNTGPGRKILISGGGRCNFTNVHTAPERFLSSNPHFAKSALSRYTAADFLALVESYGIAWHEKTLGQLFCDGSAKQIVAMLLEECAKGQVDFLFGEPVGEVTHRDGRFHVGAASAPKLVIATGGPSIPKLGATTLAYDLARQFGLKVVQPRPALVPLTLAGEDALFTELSGVSAEVVAKCGKAQFREAALFTHRGLSGPSVLQVSSYWQRGDDVGFDFLPNAAPDWLLEAKRQRPRATLAKVLAEHLPERLAMRLSERLGFPHHQTPFVPSEVEGPVRAKPRTSNVEGLGFARPNPSTSLGANGFGLSKVLGDIPDKALRTAEAALRDWRFLPNGSEGFAKAEVTAGGISTTELSSQTMEAKKAPGLYAIGEAVDVTGWLGGYNFQWAWASASATGQAL